MFKALKAIKKIKQLQKEMHAFSLQPSISSSTRYRLDARN